MAHYETITHTTWVRTPCGHGQLAAINPLSETEEIYRDILNGYKTPSSKKAFISRELVKMEDFLQDATIAVTRNNGWLFGEVYTEQHLRTLRAEIKMLQSIRSEIN